jgi:hypothetical protein
MRRCRFPWITILALVLGRAVRPFSFTMSSPLLDKFGPEFRTVFDELLKISPSDPPEPAVAGLESLELARRDPRYDRFPRDAKLIANVPDREKTSCSLFHIIDHPCLLLHMF